MADFAVLGLGVDSKPVARARDELGRFTRQAGEAEQGAKKFTTATGKMRDELGRFVSAGAGATTATAKLADQVNNHYTPAQNRGSTATVGLRNQIRALAMSANFAGGPMGSLVSQVGNLVISAARISIPITLATVALGAMTAAVVKSVQAYIQLDASQRRISAAQQFTGNRAGISATGAEGIIQSLAKSTDTSISELREAGAELLKFKTVTESSFGSILAMSEKLSRTGFVKIGDAARTLADFMDSPIGKFESLRAMGFSVSAALEMQATRMVEAGRQSEAIALVFGALEKQIGTITEGKGLTGSITSLSNATGNFSTSWGKMFSSILPVEGGLRKIGETFEKISNAMSAIASVGPAAMQMLSVPWLMMNAPTADQRAAAKLPQPIGLGPRAASNLFGGQFTGTKPDDAERVAFLDQQKKKIDEVTEALRRENEIAGMSALQQRIVTQLRLANTDATTKEGKAIASLVVQNESLQMSQQFRESSKRRILDMQTEISIVGKSAGETARLRMEQDAINESISRGIVPSGAYLKLIKERAAVYGQIAQQAADARLAEELMFERRNMFETAITATVNERIRSAGVDPNSVSGQMLANQIRYNEQLKLSKELATDFALTFTSEFRSALREGENAWDAFAKAGTRALNKIADRLMDIAIQNLVGKAFGSSFGGMFSSIFGGGVGASAGGGLTASARGNIFSQGNVIPFAQGAAFSNGVVSQPTYFPMANGNTGLMGEKDQEAIIPLKRGAGGRMGVDASGIGGGSAVRIYLDDGLKAEIVEAANGNAVEIVKQSNRYREKKYQAGGSK